MLFRSEKFSKNIKSEVFFDYEIKNYNWFNIGGKTKVFFKPNSLLANDYGMKEGYLWPVNAESQVTPKRMVDLIKLIKENDIPTIFCESTVSSKAQMEVAKSSGAVFGGTFYVDSLSGPDGPAPTYIKLLRHNVRLIIEGLIPKT